MRTTARNREILRCAVWPALLGLFALFAVGCGGGARRDVDLNSGEIQSGLTAEQMKELQEAFPLLGQSGTEQAAWTYRICEGDQLEVVFFTHPEQNRFVSVRPDGRITMPYVGDVVAAGKEPPQLAAELTQKYSEVLVEPRIDVIVQTMGARFYVLGEVNVPGEIEYVRRLDLMQALARAGGYSNRARLSSIVLIRKGESGDAYAGIFDFRKFMDAETRIANIEIRPDDIIWVPRSAVARWDNATKQAFTGLLSAESVVLTGWQIARFDDVYQRGRF